MNLFTCILESVFNKWYPLNTLQKDYLESSIKYLYIDFLGPIRFRVVHNFHIVLHLYTLKEMKLLEFIFFQF